LKIENEKILSFSKPATTTKIILFYFILFFLRPRGRTRASARTLGCIRADAVFTASADGKNPSAGKTASAG
jgi:hypothetical protein